MVFTAAPSCALCARRARDANRNWQVLEDASVTFTFVREGRYVTLKELTTAADDLAELITDVAEQMEASLRDANRWAVNGLGVGSAVLASCFAHNYTTQLTLRLGTRRGPRRIGQSSTRTGGE